MVAKKLTVSEQMIQDSRDLALLLSQAKHLIANAGWNKATGQADLPKPHNWVRDASEWLDNYDEVTGP